MPNGIIDGRVCGDILRQCPHVNLAKEINVKVPVGESTIKRFITDGIWPTRKVDEDFYIPFSRFFKEKVHSYCGSLDNFKTLTIMILENHDIEQNIIDKIKFASRFDNIIEFIFDCARSGKIVTFKDEALLHLYDTNPFLYLEDAQNLFKYFKQLEAQAKKPADKVILTDWETVKLCFERFINFTRIHYQTLARFLPQIEPDKYPVSACICDQKHMPLFFAGFLIDYADYLTEYFSDYSDQIILKECLLERVNELLEEATDICLRTKQAIGIFEAQKFDGTNFFIQLPEMDSSDCQIGMQTADAFLLKKDSLRNEVLSFERELIPERNPKSDSQKNTENTKSRLLINTRRNEYCFTPVCCSVFDSVAGKNAQNIQEVQQKIFQLAASGKTLLLQPPQVLDNRTILTLLNNSPEFRILCREGIVTFSSFSIMEGGKQKDFLSPEEYLLYCLENPKFTFSSTELYSKPEIREIMKHAIISDTASLLSEIPFENGEEIHFLYEGYQNVKECFTKTNILKYHQNSRIRYPPYNNLVSYQKQIFLSNMIEDYLNMLKRDTLCISKERELLLENLLAVNNHILENLATPQIKTRSEYDAQITLLKEQNVFDFYTLERFKKIVYYCYYITNGLRSCNQLWVPQIDDDMLCLHSFNQKNSLISQENKTLVNQTFQQFKGKTHQNHTLMDMENIMNITMDARQIYWENRDKTTDERNSHMENKLGIVFAGDCIAASYRTKTFDGTETGFSNKKATDMQPVHSDIYNTEVS